MSDLEALLLAHIRGVGLPEPAREYRFHPVRRWRFDYAYPDALLGIECDGATWARGRHTRGAGYAKDAEKYDEAAILGWRVLRFTRDQIESGYAVGAIERALGKEGTGRHG